MSLVRLNCVVACYLILFKAIICSSCFYTLSTSCDKDRHHFGLWCRVLTVCAVLSHLVLISQLPHIINVSISAAFTVAFQQLSASSSLPLSQLIHKTSIKLSPVLSFTLLLPYHCSSLSFNSSLYVFLPFFTFLSLSIRPSSSRSPTCLNSDRCVIGWLMTPLRPPLPTLPSIQTHLMFKWNCTYFCSHIFTRTFFTLHMCIHLASIAPALSWSNTNQ